MPAKRREAGPGDPRHGTPAGYFANCRCKPCKSAGKARRWEKHVEKMRRIQSGELAIPHGLTGYLGYYCRCEICRLAGAASREATKAKKEKEASHDES